MENTMDLEAILQEFNEFAYGVSHDLRAPARGMIEFAKLLQAEQKDVLSEDGELYLSLIIENGNKLQAMLTALLDYSRLNTMAKPFAKINCNDILRDCQLVLQDKIAERNASLDIAPLPHVKADADQLMQLFLILLDNALKFYAPDQKTKIIISAEKIGTNWQFKIHDNGIGIEPEFHKRVFQAFRRLHADNAYSGVGMGLTMAKKIVERHGGNIWLLPVAAVGTTIIFSIPENGTSEY